jgi:hypothetical protein
MGSLCWDLMRLWKSFRKASRNSWQGYVRAHESKAPMGDNIN